MTYLAHLRKDVYYCSVALCMYAHMPSAFANRFGRVDTLNSNICKYIFCEKRKTILMIFFLFHRSKKHNICHCNVFAVNCRGEWGIMSYLILSCLMNSIGYGLK